MSAGDLGAGPTAAPAGSTVEIRRAVLDEVTAHACQEAPNECCGVLIGTRQRIERAVRARNTLESATRYQIDPRDQFAAIRSARERGEAVIGFYHSHPSSPPAPSETDRAEAAYPGYYYLIVSPGSADSPRETRGFRFDESGNFEPITLVPCP